MDGGLPSALQKAAKWIEMFFLESLGVYIYPWVLLQDFPHLFFFLGLGASRAYKLYMKHPRRAKPGYAQHHVVGIIYVCHQICFLQLMRLSKDPSGTSVGL